MKNQGKILRKVPPKYNQKSKQALNASPPHPANQGKPPKKDQVKDSKQSKGVNDSTINFDVTTEAAKNLNQDIFMIFNVNSPLALQTYKNSI